MSYLVKNIYRFARELRDEPLSRLPRKLLDVGRPKALKMFEATATRTGISGILARAYRGPGIALMFHEIQSDVDGELRTGCDSAQLAAIVEAVLATGREIVTIDEALQRLKEPTARPFALLTFDDGYRDTQTNALPVLEHYEAPMTLFVPTEVINRRINAWWLVLRERLQKSSVLEMPPLEKTFICNDLPSKTAALRQITSWVGTNQNRADAVSASLADPGTETANLVDSYAMDEVGLKKIATHPLVTIGAHTESHRFLSCLSEDEVRAEFTANKAYLEKLLEQRIDYLAYPYGTEGACGAREARLAGEAGFKASFTTRPGHIFTAHLEHLQLLPRIDVGYAPQSTAALESRLCGLHRAITSGFGAPVATLS